MPNLVRSRRKRWLISIGSALVAAAVAVTVTVTFIGGAPRATKVAPSGAVPCALTFAAGANGTSSCWATHTGVQGATGCSPAQIEAQTSRCGANVFRHVTGNVTAVANQMISHEWISGCVSIPSAATNVTIEDSLITNGNDFCKGGDGVAQVSAINNGNASGGSGLLIENTTVVGSGTTSSGDTYGVSLHNGECLRCNVSGFSKNVNSVQKLKLYDSFIHGTSPDLTSHDDPVFLDSASSADIEHSYINGQGACGWGGEPACNGGGIADSVAILADYGSPNHITINDSYMEGDYGFDSSFGGCPPHDGSYMTVTNNAFSNSYGDGKSYARAWWAAGPGNVWHGNYTTSRTAGARMGPAPAVGC